MANFPPLKNYIFYCLDRLSENRGLEGPFLDVGCGSGDVSAFLARKGWPGKAIDISETAIRQAKKNLAACSGVQVSCQAIDQETGLYGVILLMDIIEHVEGDSVLLKHAAERLRPGGHLVISVPSNPREWRWDDDFYGHVRRYTREDLEKKLQGAGLAPLVFWDFTYPFFWIMRRLYTLIKRPPKHFEESKLERTVESSARNAWHFPLLARGLSANLFFWRWVYAFQFRYGRGQIARGHEMIVLARKEP